MTRVRDTQRSRVYRAEDKALGERMRAGTKVGSRGEYVGRTPPGDTPHVLGSLIGEYVAGPGTDIDWYRQSVRWVPTPYALSLTDCNAWAERMRLFLVRHPRAGEGSRLWIRVTDGRGHRRAVCYGNDIALPRWARTKAVLCHEVAHSFTDDHHGPEFCRTYIRLVSHFVGVDAAKALRREFRAARVKVAPARKG